MDIQDAPKTEQRTLHEKWHRQVLRGSPEKSIGTVVATVSHPHSINCTNLTKFENSLNILLNHKVVIGNQNTPVPRSGGQL
jgi:hypothetical protein